MGKLTAWVVSLGSAKPTLFPFCLNRNDEIGILCFAFQTLFNKLTQVHKNLQEINLRLNHEIRERKSYEEKLQSQQTRLRHLTYKLLLTEERERRRLASELHDQISQNLAICQLKLSMFRESWAAVNTAQAREMNEIEDIGINDHFTQVQLINVLDEFKDQVTEDDIGTFIKKNCPVPYLNEGFEYSNQISEFIGSDCMFIPTLINDKVKIGRASCRERV